MARLALILLLGVAIGGGLAAVLGGRSPGSVESGPAALVAESPQVVIYTTSWCGWCARTLAHLDRSGVDYVNKDIEVNPAWARELREKTGSTGVPVLEIDGELVRGYDPERIDRLLARSGGLDRI